MCSEYGTSITSYYNEFSAGFYTPIQISNYNLSSLLCCLKGNSALPLLNEKLKVLNSCVKHFGF